jgi:two-component system OmpR family response regulator/two-component system phosphate regulon response regulator OmpR
MEDIVVVDDDAGIRELLGEYLATQGFAVRLAADARALDALLAEAMPDLLVLDLMLPGEDGLSIARRVKVAHGLPIVMLSARGEDIDRIVGLEVGADDYLPKPFNPRELVARIRAVLRRGAVSVPKPQATSDAFRFGPFEVDRDMRRLAREGIEVTLTSAEFDLLLLFVEHAGRPVSRDFIMDHLKGMERDAFDRSIDVRVNRLRKKLEDDPANPRYIRTERGVGYRFTPGAA